MTSPFWVITGSTGFVGSAITQHCHDEGVRLRTTGRTAVAGRALPGYLGADLLDPSALPQVVRDASAVVHAAGLAHQTGRPGRDRDRFITHNVRATQNLVEAALAERVQHFVLISSVSVYGPQCPTPCTEETPCHPEGPYAESKHLAEQEAIRLVHGTGMALTILRLATVYGEGDPGNIARLMRAIDRGRFFWVGTGSNQKSLVHRDDVARACLAVLRRPVTGINIYNLSAPPHPIRVIVDILAAALGRRIPRWRVPSSLAIGLARVGSAFGRRTDFFTSLFTTIKKWLAEDVYDASKFNETFSFATQVTLTEGLTQEVFWYRNQQRE